MTDYFVDPAASGAADGSNWTNAWTSLQTALDAVSTAGSKIYCRGTQTLAAQIDVDTNYGAATSDWIYVIGVNSSGIEDGTTFKLNGNSAVASCLVFTATANYYQFKHIECYGATSHGISAGAINTNGNIFDGCISRDNGGLGINGYFIVAGLITRCAVYGNSGTGIYTRSSLLFNAVYDNDSHGIDGVYLNAPVIGNLIYNNTGRGIYRLGVSSFTFNNVIDGNGDDGIERYAGAGLPIIIGNRITNHDAESKAGIDNGGTYLFLHGWNYFENNTGDNIQGEVASGEILDNGVGTNDEDQSDTLQGYTDDDPEDFNLRSDASLRRTAITIPAS